MPGFTFPSVGRLGLTSPPSRSSYFIDLRYYDPLRLPLLRLGSLRISLVSRYLAFFHLRSCPLRLALRVWEITHRRLATFLYRFACPGALRKEMAVLSSSLATPVCACPARRPRWCPVDLPWRLQDYCLPAHPHRRLYQTLARLSSWTTTIRFSGLSHAAYTLATPGFKHTLTGYACGFATDSAAHLLWWDLHGIPYSPTG